jgi:glycosyltransferase involved in cell wall biosynthesis
MNNPVIPVSVIIPVKNEEKNLSVCLSRLKGFSQVIVIDSSSKDNTCKIVQEAGVELVQFEWNGKFPKKRNWALRNCEISNEWVLFLDADEYIDEKFKRELKNVIQNPSCHGYWVYYENNFLGKTIRHGDRMKKLPLFRRGKGEYEKINDDMLTHLDMEIHEHPIISGQAGVMKSSIEHNDYKGIEAYISRHNHYSTWEAYRYYSAKQNWALLTLRQKVKYSLLNTWLIGPLYFIYSYIIKFGFLDGTPGLSLAVMKCSYLWNIKIKIRDIKINEATCSKE